jgi:serine O-acetyltransferase
MSGAKSANNCATSTGRWPAWIKLDAASPFRACIVKGGKRHPNVGDHVIIYPNSTILGGETVIGANSSIGANVFLMHSVPPDSFVVYDEKQLVIRDKSARQNDAPLDWVI